MPLKCQKKRHETRVSAEKKYRKDFAWSTACRRYLTRLSRKKDGALLALLRRSRLTSGCPWGAGTVSFRCLWTKQRSFCGLAIIFSWTCGMSSPFSHLSRSVTRSGSSVTRGLFSAWSSSRHDGQPHHGILQSMSWWWMSFKSFNKSFI